MKCSKCRKTLLESTVFCPYCGQATAKPLRRKQLASCSTDSENTLQIINDKAVARKSTNKGDFVESDMLQQAVANPLHNIKALQTDGYDRNHHVKPLKPWMQIWLSVVGCLTIFAGLGLTSFSKELQIFVTNVVGATDMLPLATVVLLGMLFCSAGIIVLFFVIDQHKRLFYFALDIAELCAIIIGTATGNVLVTMAFTAVFFASLVFLPVYGIWKRLDP